MRAAAVGCMPAAPRPKPTCPAWCLGRTGLGCRPHCLHARIVGWSVTPVVVACVGWLAQEGRRSQCVHCAPVRQASLGAGAGHHHVCGSWAFLVSWRWVMHIGCYIGRQPTGLRRTPGRGLAPQRVPTGFGTTCIMMDWYMPFALSTETCVELPAPLGYPLGTPPPPPVTHRAGARTAPRCPAAAS